MVVVGGCAPESSLGVVVIISVGGRYREKRRMGVTCRCGSLCSWCRAHLPPYISPPSLRQDSTKQRAETKADTHTQKTGERSWTHTQEEKKKGGKQSMTLAEEEPFLSPPPLHPFVRYSGSPAQTPKCSSPHHPQKTLLLSALCFFFLPLACGWCEEALLLYVHQRLAHNRGHPGSSCP
jgi:hypothetical protein